MNVKGKNPFKDICVREAFYKTIDVELIKNRVMRGCRRRRLMIAPQLYPLFKDFTRPKLRPDGAKKPWPKPDIPTASSDHDWRSA
jgi:peptide/nickel transport system substrate-binding protein